jgi:hypothetical protein
MAQYIDFNLDNPEHKRIIRDNNDSMGQRYSWEGGIVNRTLFSGDWADMEGAMMTEYNDKSYNNAPDGAYHANGSLAFAKGINVAANNRIFGDNALDNSFINGTQWASTLFGAGERPLHLDSTAGATHLWLDTSTNNMIAKKGLYTWQYVTEFIKPGGGSWQIGAALAGDDKWEGIKKAYDNWMLKVDVDYREQALGWAYCQATNCEARTLKELFLLGERAHKWAAEKMPEGYVSPYEGYRVEEAEDKQYIDVPEDSYIPKEAPSDASLWVPADEARNPEILQVDLIRCCDVKQNGRYIWGYMQVRAKVRFPSGQIETKIMSEGTRASTSLPYTDNSGSNTSIEIQENTTDSEIMYEGVGGWPAKNITHSKTGEPVSLNALSYNFIKPQSGGFTYASGVKDHTGKRRWGCQMQNLYTA